ncbi:MAG: PIG-L family deacetylase [Pelagimonas sp.]|jgi:LmbE family N-acetylglucosaminyl deacetylase|nr:PIG-L family deacetylase [Pelagimonas sp.]
MPLTDLDRIHNDRLSPHIVTLWRALRPLQTVVSYMNTGAHPDDEHSAMLAALAWRDGVDISYACSTRGEGGQNNLGTQAGSALGVLRTEEMERACDALNMRMYWHSESPDDSITDFGFSKSGVDTLARWGRARTIKRMVDILRAERPDIVCPTFLDVPGQHGHHRAMTEAVIEAYDLAADPDYTDSALAPWAVKKLFLPAWSGAGQSYDDEVPPPPATCTVVGQGADPVTGWSYARIGQQSRGCHVSQGMGQWIPAGQGRDYPLHLLKSRVDQAEASFASGLPLRLSDLDIPTARDVLQQAQDHMDQALTAFPDCDAILTHATAALGAVRRAIGMAEGSEWQHKLTRKEIQLSHLIRVAARAEVIGRLNADVLQPCQKATLEIEALATEGIELQVSPILPKGWHHQSGTVTLDAQAAPSDPYPSTYFPQDPRSPCLQVTVTARGATSQTRIPLEHLPLCQPALSIPQVQDRYVLNRATGQTQVTMDLSTAYHSQPDLTLNLPQGWRQELQSGKLILTLPDDIAEGAYEIALTVQGEPVQFVQHIQAGRGAPRLLTQPATLTVQVMSVDIAPGQVGYIGAGKDRVDTWLGQIGANVCALSNADLSRPEVLDTYDSIIIGVFAMKMREGLLDHLPALHDWVNRGGTLLTLYHRPWDNWDPETVPLRRLEIGQPSLRWRVTDETAAVTALAPDHDLLNWPNSIQQPDWEGWHKERGLYFAKDWDEAYQPLLSMADRDEAPLTGSLLAADIGQGRHIHTALILHHQLEKQVPGAYRLMANLIAPRRR